MSNESGSGGIGPLIAGIAVVIGIFIYFAATSHKPMSNEEFQAKMQQLDAQKKAAGQNSNAYTGPGPNWQEQQNLSTVRQPETRFQQDAKQFNGSY